MEGLTRELRKYLGNAFDIHSYTPLTGGDINSVYKISSTKGLFCVKINSRFVFPKMFAQEAKGLELLAQNSAFTVPKVICTGEFEDKTYLLLSFIESAQRKDDFWNDFGIKLAKMHLQSASVFGLDHSNYIGSLPQGNTPANSWSEFYGNQRLLSQTKSAFDKGRVEKSFIQTIETICNKLDTLFPDEPPALLHGDLWAGNYMVDRSGGPAIIDPAVYYGHREMDLGMMQLFGGFDPQVFELYNEIYPLEVRWKERIQLCQLYPILVHLNLFGGGYLNQAVSIIKKYA